MNRYEIGKYSAEKFAKENSEFCTACDLQDRNQEGKALTTRDYDYLAVYGTFVQ